MSSSLQAKGLWELAFWRLVVIRWLNGRFGWRRPDTYEVTPARIASTQEERANAHKVPTYSREELCLLWKYAAPFERLFILLGLNCGFAAAEISHLRRSEIEGKYIKRIRGKTGVHGEWMLWEETGQAIEWYLKYRRPTSDLPELIISKTGNPIWKRTKGKNRNQTIASMWKRLLDRVQKDHKDFNRLSFKYLRKTSGNFIRQKFGGELMKTFHARGKPVQSDEHSERYSNRRFKRVFKALIRMRRSLQPMFDAVPEPFPAKVSKPSSSQGTIHRIRKLREQGYKYKKICEPCHVCMDTVRRYRKAPEKEERVDTPKTNKTPPAKYTIQQFQ